MTAAWIMQKSMSKKAAGNFSAVKNRRKRKCSKSELPDDLDAVSVVTPPHAHYPVIYSGTQQPDLLRSIKDFRHL